MNSESAKELLKLWNSACFAETARGKVCDFAFLTSSVGGGGGLCD